MASLKRRWEEVEFSDDDDNEPTQRQLLPVANLPEDFSGEPKDGLEYLFTVRRDAQSLPHVTRVPNPYETTETTPTLTDSRVIPEHIAMPSDEWRQVFETRIRNFRQNVRQPTIHVAFTPQNQHVRVIPEKKERDSWWSFLAGKPESEWNPPKQTKQASARRKLPILTASSPLTSPTERMGQQAGQTGGEDNIELVYDLDPSGSLPTPTESLTASESKEAGPSMMPVVYKPREPTPSLLSHIDERMALHLLMYFAHWINHYLQNHDSSFQPRESHARWIFALLGKVEDYISADDTNLLRNLARACIALLKELLKAQDKPEGEPGEEAEGLMEPAEADTSVGYMNVRSCWIIISTVTGVWAQHDLWMDAEEMLKSLGSKNDI